MIRGEQPYSKDAGAGNNWHRQVKTQMRPKVANLKKGFPKIRTWAIIELTLEGGGLGHYGE